MSPFAIYFPQFYPTPTNDKAWGKGFTDWSLIARANMLDAWPRRAPARGFYDGSDPTVHRAHIEEARHAGLGGFAVYHYWFYTHQELDAFERTALSLEAPASLPWFLVWACEGWSRRWLGDPTQIVDLARQPAPSEIERHCDHLARCFSHPAYLRIDGRPLFCWYHLGHFERPEEVIARYRDAFARRGVEPLHAHFIKNPYEVRYSPLVDFSYLFEPRLFFGTRRKGRGPAAKAVLDLLSATLGGAAANRVLLLADRFQQKGRTYPAQQFVDYMMSAERAALVEDMGGTAQDVISPGWNNAPRYSDRFTSLESLSREDFIRLLQRPSRAAARVPLLINAWNEWSEGAAVEPCAYLGHRYLDALASPALASAAPDAAARPCAVGAEP